MSISEESHYTNLTTQLRYLNDKMIDAFNLYIKLASAIIGGTLYAHLTLMAVDSRRTSMRPLSSALLSLVGVSVIIIILNNLTSWMRYRATLGRVFPEIQSKPSVTAWLSEALMCLVIAVTCVGFWIFNPL